MKCATGGSLKIQDAKNRQNSPSAHHRTTLSGCIFATEACIDNRKKLLNSNTSSTRTHNMANFGPLTAETSPVVWGIRANFNGFRVLASLLQRSRSPEANQTFARSLVDSWAATLYIHYGGASAPYNGILPGAKFTLRPSFAFFCVGRELSQRVPPIFGWAAITFGIGPHSSSTLHALP